MFRGATNVDAEPKKRPYRNKLLSHRNKMLSYKNKMLSYKNAFFLDVLINIKSVKRTLKFRLFLLIEKSVEGTLKFRLFL